MKQHQKGEVMIAIMVVMLAIVLLRDGYIGMMGHGGGHTEERKEVIQQEKADAPAVPATQQADGNQH